jgi:hypothetical protein
MKNYYKILLLVSSLFLIGNLIIALNKPVWLDEAATLLIIDSLAPTEVINKYYNGIDTHPPLYFVIASAIHVVFDSIESLRILSFILILLALYFNFLFLREMGYGDAFFIFILIFTVTNYSMQYISFEIRPYSLFYLLFSIHLYLYTQLQLNRKYFPLFYVCVLTALLYTHYFAIYYIILWASLDLIVSIKQKYLTKRILCYVFPALLFLPWVPAIFNQFNSFGNVIYHMEPTYKIFLSDMFNYFRYLSIPFIFIIVYFLYGRFNSLRFDLTGNGPKIYILILSIVILPILIYFLSKLDLAVFSHRYFIPSFLGLLILVSGGLGLIFNKISLFVKYAIIIVMVMLGMHRINQTHIHSQNAQKQILFYQGLGGTYPLATETPHTFLPSYYYDIKLNGTTNVYLINDSESVMLASNVQHQLFDFYWLQLWKREFDIENVLSWEEFKNKFSEFYIVDEARSAVFEYRIESNENYKTKVFSDSIYFVTNKVIQL